MTCAIELRDVTAGYRGSDVLHSISCAIDQGEMTAIIGPNGSGKTTLLRTMTGRIHPREGTLHIFGRKLSSLPARQRAELVGVVPQSIEVPVGFSVYEIVMMGRTSRFHAWRGPDRRDHDAVDRAMVFTDVDDLRDKPFAELSGGERQRVVIAMVLAQQPRVILLDEATSHLDINHRIEVMHIVERMNQEHGTTVVSISHDLNLASEFCSRLILLHNGNIAADGPPTTVLQRDTLKDVYQCDVCVSRNPASGSVNVMPAPRLVPEASGCGRHVHIIAGGGTGDEIMRRITLANYRVTAGVLNEGDSDSVAARALGADTVLAPAFSPVGEDALDRAMELAASADAVIITTVPFGSGNTANLCIAEAALERGARVLLQTHDGPRDYTQDHTAQARLDRIVEQGAIPFTALPELVDLLPVGLIPTADVKGRFPMRIGTSSYIVPAGLLPNAEALASRVDDVELLIFESDEVSNLPSSCIVDGLAALTARHALSFTIHLPTDIRLGSADETERLASIEKCRRVIDRMRPVNPFAYVLHLAIGPYPGPTRLEPHKLLRWRDAASRSLERLLTETGLTSRQLAVETLMYPMDYMAPVIVKHDLSVCIDIGHLQLCDVDVTASLDQFWDRTRVIHIHGIKHGRDHASLEHQDQALIQDIMNRQRRDASSERIMTVEVFNADDFAASMRVLVEHVS